MRSFVEVIGAGTPDSSSVVQLFFDDARYIFECGDGTQRLFAEYGVKFSHIKGVYLSSLSAPSVAGLFGFLLTFADVGKHKLQITAPKGLANLLRAARIFMYRPSLSLHLTEVDSSDILKTVPTEVAGDHNVIIHAVTIHGTPGIQKHANFGAAHQALCYICRIRDVPGKLNPKRAIQLGVKKGPDFGLLKKGKTVVTDEGKTVKPADVVSPDTPGPIVLIISCPSIHHVHSLTSCRSLKPKELDIFDQNHPSNLTTKRICILIHFTPKDVLDTPAYRAWTDSFGDHVEHIPVHPSVNTGWSAFLTQNEDLALLHYTVDNAFFPLPCNTFQPSTADSKLPLKTEQNQSERVINYLTTEKKHMDKTFINRRGKWTGADFKLKYILSPTSAAGPNRIEVRPRYLQRSHFQSKPKWRDISAPYASEPLPDGPEGRTPNCIMALKPQTATIRFFGTGACLPGKHRNVSSTMVDMFERGSVLLDCGEGTWGQIVRHVGLDRAQRMLCGMKIIFISHIHADHHLGLTTILHERNVALKMDGELGRGPQLVIIGPSYLMGWLASFQAASSGIPEHQESCSEESYRFFDASALTDPQAPETKIFADTFGLELGCVEVIHCPSSYGIVIKDCLVGWKVVYSGDTRPCDALAEAGKDATLAIHEATFEDELLAEAKEKMHSTIGEALDICANKMKAWRTILTHFSQRYPKIPMLHDSVIRKLHESRASIAFDLMCVDMSRLEELPRITRAFRDTFPDEVAADELKNEQNGKGQSRAVVLADNG